MLVGLVIACAIYATMRDPWILQDSVSAAQLSVFPPQPLDLGNLLTADPRPGACIHLTLSDPPTDRLRRAYRQQLSHLGPSLPSPSPGQDESPGTSAPPEPSAQADIAASYLPA
jgi:hypothetical protein